jgi:salicylate hydroxylase
MGQYTEISKTGQVLVKQAVNTRRDFGAPWLLNHRVDLHNELRRLATDPAGPGKPAVVRTAARVAHVVSASS